MAEKLGFATLAFFLFSIFSSAIDFIPYSTVARPSLVAAVVGLLVVGLSGRGAAIFRHKITIVLVALTVWFVAGVPFAIWPGGAVATISTQWLVAFLSLFLTAGLIWNLDQFRKIVNLISYAAIILALIALVLNKRSPDGRLMMEGRYSNSNDLATMLLISLPFLGFTAMRPDNGVRRLVAAAGFAPILLAVMGTASRGGMVGAAVALLVFFFNVGFAQKMKLMLVVSVGLALVLTIMPGAVAARFASLFSDQADMSQMDDAALSSFASAQSRKMLLLDSITVSLQHPIMGVGPGNFPVAQNTLALARGEETGDWHLTHNTYTQLSSESGIPGLLLFLAAIVLCLRCISRTLKLPVPPDSSAMRDIRAIALTLRVSLAAFLSCAIFASLAYMPVVTILSGLALALEYCATKQLAAAPPPVRTLRGVPASYAWQGTRPRPLPVRSAVARRA